MTSFSPQGWEEYGCNFVSTFREFWPPSVRLICYWEGECPDEVGEGWNLLEIEPCASFIERHRDNLIVQGRSQSPRSPWGSAARLKGYAFKYDAYKFARKVFAVAHASRHVDLGKLFWIDADVITHTAFPTWLLHELLPDHVSLSYLARDGYHSELGFVGYNLDHVETHAFIMAYESTYADDLFFVRHQHWTDCHVFDDLVAKYNPVCSLIPHSSHAQPFDRSILGKYMTHRKGLRKYE